MSEGKKQYTVTSTHKTAVQEGTDKYSPEHELVIGLRRMLLAAARMIEIYIGRKWGD